MDANNTIDYIEIPARDIEKARTFFSGLFGWTFTDYGPDYISFHDGRLGGGFRRLDAAAAVATGSVLLVFYRSDLENARDQVQALGGKITQEIFEFPGGRRFHFTDPNGNEYAIWSEAEQ